MQARSHGRCPECGRQLSTENGPLECACGWSPEIEAEKIAEMEDSPDFDADLDEIGDPLMEGLDDQVMAG